MWSCSAMVIPVIPWPPLKGNFLAENTEPPAIVEGNVGREAIPIGKTHLCSEHVAVL